MISYKRLLQTSIIKGSPTKTIIRWFLWSFHCTFRKPAIIRLNTINRKMYLYPKAFQFGSTSIFIKREKYEPELLILRKFVRPGSLAIDIGGSYGIYTIFLSHHVKNDGSVITFEPGKFSLSVLSKNIEINHLNNTKLINCALSNKPGTTKLYHINGSPVNFSLGIDKSAKYETVKVSCLDDILTRKEAENLSFIKIDVEGYEAFVFDGGIETIRVSRPIIMFEVAHSAIIRAQLDISAPYTILSKEGYLFFRLNDRYRLEQCGTNKEGNIFAIHKSIVSKIGVIL